jgi:hypothetical protein
MKFSLDSFIILLFALTMTFVLMMGISFGETSLYPCISLRNIAIKSTEFTFILDIVFQSFLPHQV